MTIAPTKLITAEEFYDYTHRPENRDQRFELERGIIIELSRPGKRHGFICWNATGILGKENEELTGEDVLADLHCKVAEFFALPGR